MAIKLSSLTNVTSKDKTFKTVYIMKDGSEFVFEPKGYPNKALQEIVKKEGKVEIDASEVKTIVITQNAE